MNYFRGTTISIGVNTPWSQLSARSHWLSRCLFISFLVFLDFISKKYEFWFSFECIKDASYPSAATCASTSVLYTKSILGGSTDILEEQIGNQNLHSRKPSDLSKLLLAAPTSRVFFRSFNLSATKLGKKRTKKRLKTSKKSIVESFVLCCHMKGQVYSLLMKWYSRWLTLLLFSLYALSTLGADNRILGAALITSGFESSSGR